MDKKRFYGLNDVINAFGDNISSADMISGIVLGQISAKIAARRIEMDMTQKMFADYLGVTQGLVSRWESSDYNFSIKTLADLAVKLNMTLRVELSDANLLDNPGESEGIIKKTDLKF